MYLCYIYTYTYTHTHTHIHARARRSFHSLLQSQFSKECDLVFAVAMSVPTSYHFFVPCLLSSICASFHYFCLSIFPSVLCYSIPYARCDQYSHPSFDCM